MQMWYLLHVCLSLVTLVNLFFSSSVNVKNYALLDTLCLWRKSTFSLHIHSRNVILQMCSCTLHLLHEQTRSKNGFYRLYMSKCGNCTIFATPLFVVQKCILSPHIFCARKYLTNVFFYITFACTNKRLVKAAITAVAPIVNTVLNMKFALKQTWSNLRKCGLYAIFATHLLPAKIHFFVQCLSRHFHKPIYF